MILLAIGLGGARLRRQGVVGFGARCDDELTRRILGALHSDGVAFILRKEPGLSIGYYIQEFWEEKGTAIK
jgi:hypothetical protein